MQTREQWATTLKELREQEEHVLLGILSDIPVTFTHDTITIIAPNKSTFDILEKHRDALGAQVILKLKKHEEKILTTEQKLRNLFGDKLAVDV